MTGAKMNTVTINKPMHSNLTRQVLGACCAVGAGTLLFLASRKLTWGRDQSLADWPLWVIAALPYLAYFAAVKFSAERFSELVRRSDFLAVWTVSLFSFVLMRSSSLAHLYESNIYESTVAGTTRYAIISAVYTLFGYLTVTAWRLTFGVRQKTGALSLNYIGVQALGLLVAFILFCTGIFLIVP
jgi:hypothetical protein